MLKPGINYCDNATYHGDPTYHSSSGLKLVLEDPIKYYKKYIDVDKEYKSVGSPAMNLGSYVHSLVLEPENTDKDFAIWTGDVKKGEEWKAFSSDNKKKIIIDKKMEALGQILKTSIVTNKQISKLLEGGESEFTYCTQLCGANIKVRADKINLEKNYILDVKTTSKALTKEALMGTIASLHYDLSAALYIDCFKQINNVPHMDFYFLFVNTKDTLDAQVFKASDALIANGRRKYRKAIKKLKYYLETNAWRSESIEEIDIPFWAMIQEEVID